MEALEFMVQEIADEQVQRYENHIGTFREKYRKEKDFHKRKGYYLDVLQKMEEGYKLAKERMLNLPPVKRYEYWLNAYNFKMLTERGFKEGLRHELLFGNLT